MKYSIAAALLVLGLGAATISNAAATDGDDLPRNQALALNTSNELLRFSPRQPGRVRSRLAVTNLKAGERLVGIDIASGDDRPSRPMLGRLFGDKGDTALAALQRNGSSRLYSIDVDSGRARDRGRLGDGSAVRDIAISPMD
jgi:hypothetical protein